MGGLFKKVKVRMISKCQKGNIEQSQLGHRENSRVKNLSLTDYLLAIVGKAY